MCGDKLEFQRGGDLRKKSLCEGGMDIFWKYIIQNGLKKKILFTSVNFYRNILYFDQSGMEKTEWKVCEDDYM